MVTLTLSIDDVSETLRTRLNELTLGPRFGQMSRELSMAHTGGSEWVVIARRRSQPTWQAVTGWALAFQRYGHCNLQVFVDPDNRGHGIGMALVRAAIAHHSPLYVTAGSDEAARLFYPFGKHLVIKNSWDGRTDATKKVEYGYPS